jgi:hypothetical protein
VRQARRRVRAHGRRDAGHAGRRAYMGYIKQARHGDGTFELTEIWQK